MSDQAPTMVVTRKEFDELKYLRDAIRHERDECERLHAENIKLKADVVALNEALDYYEGPDPS